LRLGRQDLIDRALCRAAALVAPDSSHQGRRWLLGDDELNPGFFTGISGVGYELLRLTHPDVLPSVLLWE